MSDVPPTATPIAPPNPTLHNPIAADDINDNDSSLGDDPDNTSTTSLSSSIYAHRHENGRTYHAYKDGIYLGPNDAPEQDRLDLQHHLFGLTFGGRLCCCPLSDPKTTKARNVHRVLDVGTGTGIWAIDFADENPGSMVLGVDLSAIQPGFVPPNVEFQVDDLEEEWTFREGEGFDFVYARMMTSSFQNWERFFEQSFRHMNPGAYIELADMVFPVQCDDDTMPPDSSLRKWANLILEGTTKIGRPIDSAKRYRSQLEAAGFVNIVEERYVWPQNRWPRDKKLKEIGMWSHANMAPSLEGFSMALFTRVFGWTKEEVEVFLVDVRKEVNNPKIHAYWPVYVIYAQKPK